jgi:aspartate carbamoyltransferase catalytic subunit
MGLVNRSLVTIDDFSNQEIESVFSLANELSDSMSEQSSVCQGKIMASLFFEPSTRTRLSFEAAMHRLGGGVISVAEPGNTSLAKGESVADMAKVVGSYADIIVIRHPWEGAAKVVADYAGIPVINAGDGGHEHPTQTLCDLYTIKKERQTLEGLKIALWGDLKYGRTIHSLAYALARFGATIHFRPGSGLGLPEHVTRKLTTEYGGILERYNDVKDKDDQEHHFPLDAIYVTASKPHQLTNIPDVSIQIELKKGVDALYITRVQRERFESTEESQESDKDYPVVDKKLLKGKQFDQALVMHPLPRIDELAYEIDADPRSMYFKQAARGVPIRMALIALLLGSKQVEIPEQEPAFGRKVDHRACDRHPGVKCKNEKCVSVQRSEMKYIKSDFRIVDRKPLTLRCVYCEHEMHPPYIASSKWHEGTLEHKQYYSSDSSILERIKTENLIIFGSEADAEAEGFKPSPHAHIAKKR